MYLWNRWDDTHNHQGRMQMIHTTTRGGCRWYTQPPGEDADDTHNHQGRMQMIHTTTRGGCRWYTQPPGEDADDTHNHQGRMQMIHTTTRGGCRWYTQPPGEDANDTHNHQGRMQDLKLGVARKWIAKFERGWGVIGVLYNYISNTIIVIYIFQMWFFITILHILSPFLSLLYNIVIKKSYFNKFYMPPPSKSALEQIGCAGPILYIPHYYWMFP